MIFNFIFIHIMKKLPFLKTFWQQQLLTGRNTAALVWMELCSLKRSFNGIFWFQTWKLVTYLLSASLSVWNGTYGSQSSCWQIIAVTKSLSHTHTHVPAALLSPPVFPLKEKQTFCLTFSLRLDFSCVHVTCVDIMCCSSSRPPIIQWPRWRWH